MKIVKGSLHFRTASKYPVVTLGNYDGVHKGHQKIVKATVKAAKAHRGKSILYTFYPHPARFLSPELAPRMLQTMEQKAEMLEGLGLDIMMVEPFTKALSKLSAVEFFKKILVERIGAKEIIVGYDFTFGAHRSGSIDDLQRLSASHGIRFHVVEAVFSKESLLSSTHIRKLVEKGEMESAEDMLGRPYALSGKVIRGRGIGKELGFRTANLKTANELIPPPGVYITETMFGKKIHRSATNIGYNPTFGGTELTIETYVLDFKGNLLGKKMEVLFHKKIRREMTFESVDDLRAQIARDVEQARNYHEKRI